MSTWHRGACGLDGGFAGEVSQGCMGGPYDGVPDKVSGIHVP